MLKIRSEMANNDIELESSSSSSDFLATKIVFLVPVMNMLVGELCENSSSDEELNSSRLENLHGANVHAVL